MPTLNELQKRQVIKLEPTKSADYMLVRIQKYDNLSLDDFPNMQPAKRAHIQERLNSMPNPNEQEEWGRLASMLNTPSQELLHALESYIQHWESTPPCGNHLDEARQMVSSVRDALQREQADKEQNEWVNVDVLSKDSLIAYLRKYPNTIHTNEIDDCFWPLVDMKNVQEIQTYLDAFPQGRHVAEARELLNAIVEWDNVKGTNDIFEVSTYLRNNRTSPFSHQAKLMLMRLKQEEIGQMRDRPNSYDAERLKRLLIEHVVTDNELIMANVMTENVLETLRSNDITYDLPDINRAIAESRAECKEGFTDVFFFGIPSTGKTCVLMGLSRSDSLHINLASGGGDYASALQQYTDVGITVPRTPGSFVTTLEATICPSGQQNIDYKVNLVEMSGEEFAFGIANNPDHIFTFEEMGSGATELLKNANRKAFFLIIDPTVNVVRFSREVLVGFDEETGERMVSMETCAVNQRVLIQKMVNLFQDPNNSEIMKKVDSIHIIMTKADTLGDPIEREEKAYEIFQNRFGNLILSPLLQLCKEYNINSNNGFCPNLYTFSLGSFYVGGLYEYEQADSDKLIRAIENSIHPTKRNTFWDKFKKVVNQ